MNWFKKLFNKNKDSKMTQEQLDEIKTQLSKYEAFQWIKTENAGMVTRLSDVVFDGGIIFVEFVDGSRCNYQLLNEMVLLIEPGTEPLDLSGTPVVGGAKIKGPNVHQQPVVADTPITSLLKKQKPNMIDIDISMTLNVPSAELYKVLCGSFENADKDIVDFIVADIDVQKVKDAVREAIQKYYSTNE